jgi:hypothetical protein
MNPRPRTYAGIALDELAEATRRHGRAVADLPPDDPEVDEDLAWVDHEIWKCEEGPRLPAFDTPAMNKARNERLVRLRHMRARLLGEEST